MSKQNNDRRIDLITQFALTMSMIAILTVVIYVVLPKFALGEYQNLIQLDHINEAIQTKVQVLFGS